MHPSLRTHSLDRETTLIRNIPDHRVWRRLENADGIDLEFDSGAETLFAKVWTRAAEQVFWEAVRSIPDSAFEDDEEQQEPELPAHRGDGHTEEPVLGEPTETVDVQLDIHQLHRDRRQARKEEDIDNWYYVGEITYLSRTIVEREQWNEPVRWGEDVAVLCGGCPSEGPETGSYDRPDVNPWEGTTVIVQDVPVDQIDEDDPYLTVHEGLTPEEQEIVEAFNNLDDERKEAVHERLDHGFFTPPMPPKMHAYLHEPEEEAEQALPA